MISAATPSPSVYEDLRRAGCRPADGRMIRQLAAGLRPRVRSRPSEWAAKHVTLTARMGVQQTGPFRADYFPWGRAWMDALYDHPGKRGVVGMKQAQRGFTLAMLAKMACDLGTERGDTLYVIGRQEDADMISQARFRPMIEECAPVRERLAEAMADDPTIADRVHAIGYDAGTIYFTTAQSASALSSKTIARAIIDELDQAEAGFPTRFGTLVPFVQARQYAVYYGAELWAFSHPTLWTCGVGRLYREQSDQGRWVFDCPSNGCEVALDHRCIHYSDVRPDGRPEARSAVLRCPSCGNEITDEQRFRAVWPREGGRRVGGSGRLASPLPVEEAALAPLLGFSVNGLCDPYVPLLEFAAAWARAKGTPDEQTVLNTRFGEPYELTHATIAASDLDDALRTAGPTGGGLGGPECVVMPGAEGDSAGGVRVVSVGVDVQQPRDMHTLYAAVCGFTAGGDVYAAFRLVKGLGAMLAWMRKLVVDVRGKESKTISPTALAIDDNWEGGAVRDACRELVYGAAGGGRVDLVPVRFAARSGGALSRDTPWQLRGEAKRINPAAPHLGAIDMFDLYRHHWVDRAITLIAHKKLHVVGEVPADLKSQLTSQVLTPKRATHHWQHEHELLEWDLAKGRRDDWLMALAYALAAGSIKCGSDRLHVVQSAPRRLGPIRWGV